jgi:hypothetical protein
MPLEPSLPHGCGFLDQRLGGTDCSPVIRFGAQHLLMPLMFGQPQIAQDRGFSCVNAAALVGSG